MSPRVYCKTSLGAVGTEVADAPREGEHIPGEDVIRDRVAARDDVAVARREVLHQPPDLLVGRFGRTHGQGVDVDVAKDADPVPVFAFEGTDVHAVRINGVDPLDPHAEHVLEDGADVAVGVGDPWHADRSGRGLVVGDDPLAKGGGRDERPRVKGEVIGGLHGVDADLADPLENPGRPVRVGGHHRVDQLRVKVDPFHEGLEADGHHGREERDPSGVDHGELIPLLYVDPDRFVDGLVVRIRELEELSEILHSVDEAVFGKHLSRRPLNDRRKDRSRDPDGDVVAVKQPRQSLLILHVPHTGAESGNGDRGRGAAQQGFTDLEADCRLHVGDSIDGLPLQCVQHSFTGIHRETSSK